MARLTDEQRSRILDDFHLGKSQNFLAKKYNCSPATINKLCKGIEPRHSDKVNTFVEARADLQGESEYLVNTLESEVNTQLRRRNLLFVGVEKAVKKMNDIIESGYVEDKINIGDGMQKFEQRKLNTADVKNALDGYDRASITLGVNERFSNSQTNVAIQNNNVEDSEIVIRRVSSAND